MSNGSIMKEVKQAPSLEAEVEYSTEIMKYWHKEVTASITDKEGLKIFIKLLNGELSPNDLTKELTAYVRQGKRQKSLPNGPTTTKNKH